MDINSVIILIFLLHFFNNLYIIIVSSSRLDSSYLLSVSGFFDFIFDSILLSLLDKITAFSALITLALNKSLVDEGEPLIYIIRLNKTKSCNKSSDIIGDKIIIHFKSSSSKYLALKGNIK